MDKTEAFRKEVREKGGSLGFTQDEMLKLTSAALLKPIVGRSAFARDASEVGTGIEEFRIFVKDHKRQFMDEGTAAAAANRIEEEVGLFVKTCSARIQQLKKTGENQPQISEQAVAHNLGVVLILSERLRDISIVFDNSRRQRYQRAMSAKQRRLKERLTPTREVDKKWATVGSLVSQADPDAPSHGTYQGQQVMMVEEENAALLEELGRLSQKAHSTEQMMQEIATLNQMFSDQILSQAEQIEEIYMNAVDASMNIKTGNVQLGKAIALNTTTRKYVLALLLLASFLLLFFDWFNS